MSSVALPADVRSVEVVLPHNVSAVSDARRGLNDYLRRYEVPVDRRDDARLVLSELLSNAIRYAPPLSSGDLRVSWWLDPRGVHIEVTDGCGETEPQHITGADPEALGGRGLAIVTVLTSSWGVRQRDGSRTVFAVLPH